MIEEPKYLEEHLIMVPYPPGRGEIVILEKYLPNLMKEGRWYISDKYNTPQLLEWNIGNLMRSINLVPMPLGPSEKRWHILHLFIADRITDSEHGPDEINWNGTLADPTPYWLSLVVKEAYKEEAE